MQIPFPQKEILNPYLPQAPFPQRLRGGKKERTYTRFLDIFKSLHVNIPFLETLQQMPTYIKCMKELMTKKSTLKGGQTVVMNKKCSVITQKDFPTKKKDPGSFHIPCAIGETMIDRKFCDLGASINVMPLSLMKKLKINELKPTDVILQLADKTQKRALGVVENILVKVGKYFLPADFVILEMEESYLHPIILGRLFLATARALIDVEQGELILRIHNEQLTFHVFKRSHNQDEEEDCIKIDISDTNLKEATNESTSENLKSALKEKKEVKVMLHTEETKEELGSQ
ncbi:uncharacterized protein LOC130966673 [Arachis stenosperma]|uniref:uncharacterized protein LOC130966673 n=1 Tax=Arachis stenosperma TaxID=217475 RepID=UPI0025ABDF83|nr:uncharacterized protein LOC130966673 [Arachis stenosperma]